jgi:ribulose-5-phosphate 4-epimerase/fuculose-1-phosphate aldolase
MALSEATQTTDPATDPIRQARIDLAAFHRLAVRFAMDDGIWNHFSLTVPGRPDLFLVKAHGLLCCEVTASNLIAVDSAGKTVEGQGIAETSGVCIHAPIHRGKADAACVLHSHMRYATWLSMIEGGRLMPINQNSLRYYGRISYDDHYNGLADTPDEGRRMAEVLGDNNVLILANHGVIVTGPTVAEAFYDLYYLELCCKEQFTIVSSGAEPRLIPQDVVALTQSQFAGFDDPAAELFFDALKRRLDLEEPDYRD